MISVLKRGFEATSVITAELGAGLLLHFRSSVSARLHFQRRSDQEVDANAFAQNTKHLLPKKNDKHSSTYLCAYGRAAETMPVKLECEQPGAENKRASHLSSHGRRRSTNFTLTVRITGDKRNPRGMSHRAPFAGEPHLFAYGDHDPDGAFANMYGDRGSCL